MRKPKSLLLLLLVVTLVGLGACRKQASTQPTANSNDAALHEAPVGGTAPAGEKFYYRGTIANNLSIEMILTRDGDRLTGTYFYPKVGKNINLAGTIDKAGMSS